MQYGDILNYAMDALGARPTIAESIVITIANKKTAGWDTDRTAAYFAECYGPDNPAAQTKFVETVRDQLN